LGLQEQRKRACIMVTHDIPNAKTISDRLALMGGGDILAEGTFKDLQESHNEFVAQFLSNAF